MILHLLQQAFEQIRSKLCRVSRIESYPAVCFTHNQEDSHTTHKTRENLDTYRVRNEMVKVGKRYIVP